MIKFVTKLLGSHFGKYVIVGGGAFSVEFLSFLLLFNLAHLPLFLANGISFVLGFITSFGLNRMWTFYKGRDSYQKSIASQGSLYGVLAIVNLMITLVLVTFLKNLGLDPTIAKLLAMIITSLWNFILFKKVIFNYGSRSDA